MDKMCFSCSAPLGNPESKGPSEEYCKYCTDDSGNLKSRDEITDGVAGWLKTWQPDLDDETAQVRAAHFLKAMPAWAEDDG